MAGDEKHARELIAEAREFVKFGSDLNSVEADRLIGELAAALEAALPGDDDWEYQCKLLSRDPGVQHEWVSVEADHQCGGILQRRRKAGPWLPAGGDVE